MFAQVVYYGVIPVGSVDVGCVVCGRGETMGGFHGVENPI